MSEFSDLPLAQRLRIAASLLENDRRVAARDLVRDVLGELEGVQVDDLERKPCGCVMARAWKCRWHDRVVKGHHHEAHLAKSARR